MSIKDLLISLVNAANNPVVPLDASAVTLLSPEVNNLPGQHNSKVKLVAIPGSGYTGQIEVHYDRINLSLTAPQNGISSEDDITADDVLAVLNAHSVTPLTLADVNIEIPTLEIGEVRTIIVSAKADSLGWINEVSVSLLKGLPPNSDQLYDIMNYVLPVNISL